MLPLPPADPRYGIALDEIRYTLKQQNEELRWLQNRSGQSLQFGGLIATFLGSLAIRDKAPLTLWVYLAAFSFAALTFAVVFALWPRNFQFSIGYEDVNGVLQNQEFTAQVMQAAFTKYLTFPFKDNAPKIIWIRRAYLLGIFALVAELICLLISVSVR